VTSKRQSLDSIKGRHKQVTKNNILRENLEEVEEILEATEDREVAEEEATHQEEEEDMVNNSLLEISEEKEEG
jgi:hypothetical protein